MCVSTQMAIHLIVSLKILSQPHTILLALPAEKPDKENEQPQVYECNLVAFWWIRSTPDLYARSNLKFV